MTALLIPEIGIVEQSSSALLIAEVGVIEAGVAAAIELTVADGTHGHAADGVALRAAQVHHLRGWVAALRGLGLASRSIAIALAAWRGLPSLRDPERFEAWTYRLVVRA